MNEFCILLLFILLIAICETTAMSCVKQFHISNDISYFILAIFMYSLVCFFLNKSYYYTGMGMTNVIWSGLSILMVTLAGILFFKEKLYGHDLLAGSLIATGIMIINVTK